MVHNSTDFISDNDFGKLSENQIQDQNYWTWMKQIQKLPILKCPYCKFRNIYQHSMDHHLRLTCIKGHPSPPNIQLPYMCRKEILDSEDALAGRNKRRSYDEGLECHCPTNPMNWSIPGKECTCTLNEYECKAHPRIRY